MYLNATLLIQLIVFAILWWFVAKFVWPPITSALDERATKIADGLAAAVCHFYNSGKVEEGSAGWCSERSFGR